MIRQRIFLRVLLTLAVIALLVAPALAGGPIFTCSSGQALLWPGGGAGVPFNPDQGNLGPLAHDAAVAAVQSSFAVWGAVPSSTISYTAGAELPEDVTVDNFEPYLFPVAPDGLSAIVFDHTGEIFDLLFGPDSGILGFAGPEWFDPSRCQILEGVSFLNGPAFGNLVAAQDVMVHEFGHYSGLAHTAVNGQIFLDGDTSGPTPNNTFGDPSGIQVIETMYPFYFGPGSGTASPEKDDVSMISTLYPASTFFSTSGTIAGTIFRSSGTIQVTGVNVIARNVLNPFVDAVSSLSGDFTAGARNDPLNGVYRLNGLTPGANYAVYVDQILAGGFSTPPVTLPGREEFYNGAGESNGLVTPDDPAVYTPVASVAGVPANGINVIFNAFRPGEPLPLGDDDFVDLTLPFKFKVCGEEFDSVFVNSNGSLSFGSGDDDFSESVPQFLAGPPRIAGLWRDFNPTAGGEITFDQTSSSLTVHFRNVPEFDPVTGGGTGANSFDVTLRRSSNSAKVEYGAMTATSGLAGLSCGGAVTSGFENEQNLRGGHGHHDGHDEDDDSIDMAGETAAFEIFTAGDNDLADAELTYTDFKRGFRDVFEPNNDLAHAKRIQLPFDTVSERDFSAVDPVGDDVDYYRFKAKAGDILAIELVRGEFDATLGVFDADTGALLLSDDDGGGGLRSRILAQVNADINLAVAVSAFPDLDFNGDGGEGGRYVLNINRYRGELLPAGNDTSHEVPIGFSFPFQGGRWTSVFVNSDGNLTFGGGDTDFGESLFDFLVRGRPRIAPLWDDFDATTGLVIVDKGSLFTAIHYVSVPEFFSDEPNYFSVRLVKGGAATFAYGATARSDSLVGVTEGGGAADPGEKDLSSRPVFSIRGTTYERFLPPEPFDLSYQTRLFVPFF